MFKSEFQIGYVMYAYEHRYNTVMPKDDIFEHFNIHTNHKNLYKITTKDKNKIVEYVDDLRFITWDIQIFLNFDFEFYFHTQKSGEYNKELNLSYLIQEYFCSKTLPFCNLHNLKHHQNWSDLQLNNRIKKIKSILIKDQHEFALKYFQEQLKKAA